MNMISLSQIALLFGLSFCLLAPSTYGSTTTESDLESQIEDMASQYETLELELEQNKMSDRRAIRKLANRSIEFRGFFSVGVATTDGKSKLRKINEFEEIGDEPNFQADTIAGLQLDANINDKTKYTHQMTTVGFDINHTVKTEWAYFSYQPITDFTVRAGRLRIPFYFLSESLEVGFTYPWARPPLEMYSVPLSGYEGASFVRKFSFGGSDGRVAVFAGSGFTSVSALINADLEFQDIKGVSIDLSTGYWTFHASYITASGSLEGNKNCNEESVEETLLNVAFNGGVFDPNQIECGGVDTLSVVFDTIDSFIVSSDNKIGSLYSPENWPLNYMDIAVKYENGASLFMAEYGETSVKHYFSPLGPVFYLLYGYRMDRWLPYLSIVHFVTSDETKELVKMMEERVSRGINATTGDSLRQLLMDAGTVATSRSYTVGVNYWISNNLRGKLEVAHYGNFKGTIGNFVSDPGSHNAVYSVVIDGVF